MRLKSKTLIKGLILTAPIAVASTIAISPAQAASVAGARSELVLDDFTGTLDPNSPLETIARTFTPTITLGDGRSSALADAKAEVSSPPPQVSQSSIALAAGTGTNYFAKGNGSSQTGIGFDASCGCFQFNFKATLALLTQADPGEVAQAHSSVGFKIFNTDDIYTILDEFKADFWSPTDFQLKITNTDYIKIALLDQQEGFARIEGTYQRKFDGNTDITVRGFTNNSAVASVPVPPMFAAVILPVLSWMKRRNQMKAAPQEVCDRQAE